MPNSVWVPINLNDRDHVRDVWISAFTSDMANHTLLMAKDRKAAAKQSIEHANNVVSALYLGLGQVEP